jgi:hypothetical protein
VERQQTGSRSRSKTNSLWERSAVFNAKAWDKNKGELGTHPYAPA